MTRTSVEEVLARLDAPATPEPEFATALLAVLEHELQATPDVAAPVATPRPASRRPAPRRPSLPRLSPWHVPTWRPGFTIATAAVVVLALVLTIVLVPLRPEPSAADAIAEARALFATPPSFEATVVRRQFGALIAEERGLEGVPDLELVRQLAYRDDGHFRVDVVSSSYDGAEGPWADWPEPSAGSFIVADGRHLARYLSRDDELLVAELGAHDVQDLRYAATELLDPSMHRFTMFEEPSWADSCRVLSGGTVAGREARRIRCEGPQMGGTVADIWLDEETGFLLRYDVEGAVTSSGFLEVSGTVLEVRSITYDATFEDAEFEIIAPDGARIRWVGSGAAPDRFATPEIEVATTIEVRGRSGPMVLADDTLWVVGIEGGDAAYLTFAGGTSHLVRLDPATGSIVGRTVIEPLPEQGSEAGGPLSDVSELAAGEGRLWVAEHHETLTEWLPDEERYAEAFLLSPLDAATGSPLGPSQRLDGRPAGMVARAGHVWLAVDATRTVVHGPAHFEYGGLSRLDAASGVVERSVEFDGAPVAGTSLVHDGERLWASWALPDLDDLHAPWRNVLLEIDPDTLEAVSTLELPRPPSYAHAPQAMELAEGALWIAGDDDGVGHLIRVDLATRAVDRVDLGTAPTAMAYGGDVLWIADHEAELLYQVDPTTMGLADEPMVTGPMPVSVAVGGGAVWIGHLGDGTVARIPLPAVP
jgi:hypothetical protein